MAADGGGWLTRPPADLSRPTVAALLLGRGADTAATNSVSMTPLLCAASRGHTDTAALLPDRGTNAHATSVFGG